MSIQNPFQQMQNMPEMQHPDVQQSGYPQMIPEGMDQGHQDVQWYQPERLAPKRPESGFYENLAEHLERTELSGLANQLLEEIQEDIESRSKWDDTTSTAFNYLGLKLEEFRNEPFMRACAAYDSSMATALIQSYSVAMAELFPASGPAKCEVVGVPTAETEDESERVQLFINHYLTGMDKEYYPDSQRLLLYTIFFGCAFRKVYQDPITNLPISRMITPQDFIVNNNATSLLSSSRKTQIVNLSKRDILLRQKNGTFIECDIPDEDSISAIDESNVTKNIKRVEGIDTGIIKNKTLVKFYECHVDMADDDIFGDDHESEDEKYKSDKDIPKPYIITICERNKKVVSIYRNWKEEDETYKEDSYFVAYNYLPGFGLYGIGLAQLMSSNAVTLTAIERQAIDAELLAMFPGGVKTAQIARQEKNNAAYGPAEFLEIQTGGAPIQDCLMLMPYKGASGIALQLRESLKADNMGLSAAGTNQVPENAINAPVGTTLALIEVNNRVQSTVLRSFRKSLGEELKLIKNLFAEYLPEQPYPFSVPGKESAIMKKDFNDKVNIIPVADPELLTGTHRIIRNDALIKLASAAPQIHDLREAYTRMYKSMGVEDIDKILPPPPQPQQTVPLDPITENANAMTGKPVKAGLDQDHDSHIILHFSVIQNDAQSPQPNAEMQKALTAHIQEHQAMKYLVEMQAKMGINMSDPQMLANPQVQNEIAVHGATVVMQEKQKEAEHAPLDPVQVAMADVKQKEEASHLSYKESMARIEFDSFKAQLVFESEKEKREIDREIAKEKNEVQLAIAHMKQ